jgi:regulator of sirC expression with transglutaminase-like and TPR domain
VQQGSCCRPVALREFAAALPALAGVRGLVRAAVAIARHDLADAEADPVLARIAAIAARIRSRLSAASPTALLAHAHDELFVVEGFRGDSDDYHSPANSYVPLVLARRRGLPIALALVYKAVLAELGLEAAGIAAPGHFLVRVEIEGAPAYVDPFHAGAVLSRREAFARIEHVLRRPVARTDASLPECDHATWLRRMLRNLQASFARLGRIRDQHAMQELDLLLGAGPAQSS